MDETLNSIGTLITIVVLTIAIILIPSVWVKVLAGAGIVHTMFAHDEYIKGVKSDEETDKYNQEVDQYNEEVEKYNKEDG